MSLDVFLFFLLIKSKNFKFVLACKLVYTMIYYYILIERENDMIYLGADHRGYGLKEEIKKYFESQNVEFKDYGTYSTEVTHYPLIASKVCTDMDVEKDRAILICGSGIGMSMVANKFKGIRAGICSSVMSAEDGKQHSDLNVLVLAGDFITKDDAIEIIKVWQNAEFLNGRYLERLEMIKEIEEKNMK